MEKFFTTIPGIVISLGAILAVAVTGLLYLIGIFKTGKNKEDDRLIDILQETVGELEKKVNNQKTDHDAEVVNLNRKIDILTKKVDNLERENETLTKVLQGRDAQTQKFYEEGFEAIKLHRETHDIVTTIAESIKNTNSAMEKLIGILEKLAVK